MKNVFKITFAYLAAVIGAGFASGNEAVYYFVRYGKISILGVLLTSVGFGVCAGLLLCGCKKYNVKSFNELIGIVIGKKAANVVDILLNVFMLIMLAAMISAFGEMMYRACDVPKTFSAIAFCLFCYFVILLPPEKVAKWGGITGAFIVLFICIFCFYMLDNRTTNVFKLYVPMTSSALVYTAYNSFAVCPVICDWSVYIKTIRECKKVAVMSSVFSFCALFLIWGLVGIFYGKIQLGDMPMLTLAARQGRGFMIFYCIVLFAAMLSSAVANAYGIALKFCNTKNKNKGIIAIITLGWLISSLGFTNIVTGLYKYVGFCALGVYAYIIIKIKIKSVKIRK